MRFKGLIFVCFLGLYSTLHAIIPAQIEDEFNSQEQFNKEQNEFAYKVFYEFNNDERLNEQNKQEKIDAFLNVPKNRDLFDDAFLTYKLKQKKHVITPILLTVAWNLGFTLNTLANVTEPNMYVVLGISGAATTYAGVYGWLLTLPDKKKGAAQDFYAQSPLYSCLSFKFMDPSWNCESNAQNQKNQSITKTTSQNKYALEAVSVTESAPVVEKVTKKLLTDSTSTSANPSLIQSESKKSIYTQDSSQNQVQAQSVPIPQINWAEVTPWLERMNPQNPDFQKGNWNTNTALKMQNSLDKVKAKSDNGLLLMYPEIRSSKVWREIKGNLEFAAGGTALISVVAKGSYTGFLIFGALGLGLHYSNFLDDAAEQKQKDFIDSIYYLTQNKDLNILTSDEEANFWIRQIPDGKKIGLESENMVSTYKMKTFLDSHRIPSEIYEKRTMLNSERSNGFWMLMKTYLLVGSAQLILMAQTEDVGSPKTASEKRIINSLGWIGLSWTSWSLLQDYLFVRKKDPIRKKWREYYLEKSQVPQSVDGTMNSGVKP